jgi:hypothetical protein
MSKFLIGSAVSLLLTAPAYAHDYHNDYMCSITAISGHVNMYAFEPTFPTARIVAHLSRLAAT